jgi:hypothetical protein
LKSEGRLDAIREEAERTGTVSAPGVRAAGSPLPGYHGLPLLKPPVWTWEVPAYFFVGGAAGAVATIGFAAQLTSADEKLVRDARWIAAIGAGLSAPLLIADLGRPERFLNMLRVFKPQSPMSVGAWILAAFGASTTATVVARGRLSDITAAGSALAGLGMCTYTGVLLGVSAIPGWSKHVRELPLHFGASGLASGVALLELRGHKSAALNILGFAAAAFETVAAPRVARVGEILSGPLPLLLRLAGRRKAAAALSLVGSLITRLEWIDAGRESVAPQPAATQREPESRSGKESRDGNAASRNPMPPASSEK